MSFGRPQLLSIAMGLLLCMGCAQVQAIDLNDNGMSDIWEALYPGLVPDDPETGDLCHPIFEDDPDGDDWNNLAESLMGTNPYESSWQWRRLTPDPDPAAGELRLSFPTILGKWYQLQWAVIVQLPEEEYYEVPDCDGTRTIKGYYDWQPMLDGNGQPVLIEGDGNEVTVVTTMPSVPGVAIFYRWQYAGETDDDSDELTLWDEWALGTSDQLVDTDGDSMSDAAEVAAQTDPLDYFDDETPQVVVLSGNGQTGSAGEFLPSPLMIEVRDGSGTPLPNAPVTFFVTHGSGLLFETAGGSGQTGFELRTGGDGRASLLFQLPFDSQPVHKVRAGARSRVGGYELVEFTLYAGGEGLPAQESLALWLNAESIGDPVESAVGLWEDQSGNNEDAVQVSGSGSGTRPTLVMDGIKAVYFDGSNDRLTFGSEIGQNDFTVIVLYKPEASRTPHTPATNYAARNAGLSGQRYLLAGDVGSGSSNLWPPPQPAKPAARVYSIWVAKYFSGAGGPFPNYDYDPLPNGRWSGAPSVEKRYDDTDDQYYRNNNDGDGNGPGENDNESDSYWRNRFENHVGGSYFQNWSTEHVKIKDNHEYSVPVYGTQWQEDYFEYRAKDYQLPYLQGSSQPNTALIGTVGAGISIGDNGLGCYEFRNDYNPAKANASHAAAGWQVATIRYSGKQPKLYTQGIHLGDGAVSQAANVNGPEFLGGSPYNSNFFKGKVAEVLIFDRALSDGEQALIEDYLAERANPMSPCWIAMTTGSRTSGSGAGLGIWMRMKMVIRMRMG